VKFKLDENFGPTTLRAFHEKGLDCRTVHDENLAGADDSRVLAAAVSEDRILVTMDHDLGNVLTYPPESTSGIAIINIPGMASRGLLAILVESFLIACEQRQLRGKLWIVEPGRIREHQTPNGGEPE